MCNELCKLRTYLDDKNIEWFDKSDSYIDRVHFYINGVLWSAINGFGTYGGYRGYLDFEENGNTGLIELMIGDTEPIGWLTADDVIGYIENKEVVNNGN